MIRARGLRAWVFKTARGQQRCHLLALVFFSNSTTLAECFDCPAGFYCMSGSTTYTHQLCPAGYYCPTSTRHSFEYPCPKGSYNPIDGSSGPEDCLMCPPGEYCEGTSSRFS